MTGSRRRLEASGQSRALRTRNVHARLTRMSLTRMTFSHCLESKNSLKVEQNEINNQSR